METPAAVLVVLVVAAGLAAVLSGTLGMAGGLALMGCSAALLPLEAAMAFHGATQAASNGSRAVLLLRHACWRGLGWHAAGAAAAVALLALASWRPDPALAWIGLGLVPYAAAAMPRSRVLDWTRPGAAFACGASVTALQLACGVAGPLLDAFFVESRLGRREVVATKAVTQVLAHLVKVAWYRDALARGEVPALLVAAAIPAALAGTWGGVKLLERLDDAAFREVTRRLVLALGAAFVARGAWMLVGG